MIVMSDLVLWNHSPSGLLSCEGEVWRRGSESNRRIKVLQTSPLPLGYRAILHNCNAGQGRNQSAKCDFQTITGSSQAKNQIFRKCEHRSRPWGLWTR